MDGRYGDVTLCSREGRGGAVVTLADAARIPAASGCVSGVDLVDTTNMRDTNMKE